MSTPDPNNPKPGDRFVGRYTGRSLTVRYVDDDYVFGTNDNDSGWSDLRSTFADFFAPAPPVWPEPPVRWGVQTLQNANWIVGPRGAAEAEVGFDPANRRLIRYVPEVVE